ncbi:DUF4118 domain-containing protein [uncultured Caulobacter sp.]|uniref:DUF4118 domain-containing protein n=1 Tax=uncultured Caulobacter sp. TaxID=158749 RepID=UPI002628345B|nr:DUF4118 domain-containing protein [uncultured Caulobacter sp.]
MSDAAISFLSRDRGAAWRVALLYACAVAAPVVAGMAAGLFDNNPAAALWFAPPIFLIALWGGMAPAAVTMVVALAAFDYWVVPPRNSFMLTNLSDLWILVGLAPCAAIASYLGMRLRRQLTTIRRHETRSDALSLLSHAVVSQGGSEAIYFAAAQALSRAYEAKAVVLLADEHGLKMVGGSRGATLEADDFRAADWALANNVPAGLASEAGGRSRYDFWPLSIPGQSIVLGVERKAGGSEEGLRDGVVELVGGYLLASSPPPRKLHLVR